MPRLGIQVSLGQNHCELPVTKACAYGGGFRLRGRQPHRCLATPAWSYVASIGSLAGSQREKSQTLSLQVLRCVDISVVVSPTSRASPLTHFQRQRRDLMITITTGQGISWADLSPHAAPIPPPRWVHLWRRNSRLSG